MKADHAIWVVRAGPSGDEHLPEGQFQVSSERLAAEISQLAWGLTDALDHVRERGANYELDEVTFEATFDGLVGLALLGRLGGAGTVRLKFVRARSEEPQD